MYFPGINAPAPQPQGGANFLMNGFAQPTPAPNNATLGRRIPRPHSPMGPRGLGGTVMPSLGRAAGYQPGGRTLGDARGNYGTGNPGSMSTGQASMRGQQNMADRMSGGVRPGMNQMGGPSVPPPGMGGPNLQQIQADMARRQVGSQLGPRNAALAGYMMG